MNKPLPRSMLLVSPFEVEDLHSFALQPQQVTADEIVSDGYGQYLKDNGPCFTVRRSDGSTIAVVGLLDQWEGRCLAWAILAQDAGRELLPLTRGIAKYLDASPYHRFEATIDAGFAQGHRWAKLLGFELETPKPMRKFYPNGNDAFLYARVRA